MALEEDMINILRLPTENTISIRGPSPGMDVITGRLTPLKKLPSKNLNLERQLTIPDNFGKRHLMAR
jgi:hypothetical protein